MNLEEILKVEIQKDTKQDRRYLLTLKKHAQLGKEAKVVYIYSFSDPNKNIPYPKRNGSVLYIGEACRIKDPTGERFQHISTKHDVGGNRLNNFTLSAYYYSGTKLLLRIYKVPDDVSRKALERRLLQQHVSYFGAMPIAQGTSGKNYTVNTLNEVSTQYADLLPILTESNE